MTFWTFHLEVPNKNNGDEVLAILFALEWLSYWNIPKELQRERMGIVSVGGGDG